MKRDTTTKLSWVIIAIGLVGSVVSSYLTWYELTTPRGSCPLTTAYFSCSEVLSSEYSWIGGIPVALLGLVWFIAATLLALLATKGGTWVPYLFAWSLIALAGTAILLYVEVVLIGGFCAFCTAAQVIGLAIFALSLKMWLSR